MIKWMLAVIFLPLISYAFVSGPGQVSDGESKINLSYLQEAGQIEPNENRSSYQNADIKQTKLAYTRGIGRFWKFDFMNLALEYSSFTSAEEKVGSQIFYDQDNGNFLNLSVSGDLIHTPDKKLGLYLVYNLAKKYNSKKFSNPHIDTFGFGFNTSFNMTDDVFFRSLLHYGSGDGKDQNSYLASDAGFGFRLNNILENGVTLLSSLFFEIDTSQRFDSLYDQAFSAAGTSDRIRAVKYGAAFGANLGLSEVLNLDVLALQKAGGYDARATSFTSISLGYKF